MKKSILLSVLVSLSLYAGNVSHDYSFKAGWNKFSIQTANIEIIKPNGTVKLGYQLGTYDSSIFKIGLVK
jgi:hypothetical protein